MACIIGGSVYWRDRFCTIVDGMWAMSRVGVYSDFNYAAGDNECAVAGRVYFEDEEYRVLDEKVGNFTTVRRDVSAEEKKKRETTVGLVPIDDERLVIVQASGDIFILQGNPCEGAVLDHFACSKR